MKSLFAFGMIGFLFLHLSYGQEETAKIIIDVQGDVQPWNHLEINDSEDQFQFAIVTDRTGGHRPGIFLDGVHKLNLLQPEFVMSVGDLIEGYTEDEVEIDRQWNEFDGFIDELEMPFFYVAGNHDYTNPVMARKWEERLGTSYYHFIYKDVLFLAINSERAVASGGKNTFVDDAQYEYVKKTLEENAGVRWTLVFMHKPMWIHDNTGKWPEIEALLKDRKHTVFAGHHHHFVKYERNNGKYFMLATTGGGSGLRGAALGEFDHVVWATMTDDGPVLANLMLEGIWGEDVVTEEQWDFVGPLRRAQPVRISPILVDEPLFSTGTSQVRLTNDADVPMELSLDFDNYLHLRPETDQIHVTVAPNSVEMLEIPLSSNPGMGIEELSALKIEATSVYKKENLPALELTSVHQLRPIMPMEIPKAISQKEIDGDPADWQDLPYKFSDTYVEADPFSHKGPDDAQVAFGVSHDAEFIYLAAHVQDDQLLLDSTRSAWQQDGIAFQIHAGPIDQSANATSIWSGMLLMQNPGMKAGEPGTVFRPNRLPKGVEYAIQHTEGGYFAEMAIPASLVDTLQGKAWEYLRLNVAVMDFDEDYTHETRLLWQPAWDSERSFVGSGTFRRKMMEGSQKEETRGEK